MSESSFASFLFQEITKGCASKPNCNTHFDLLRKAVTGGRFSLIISERIPFVLMRKKKKKILEEKSVQMSNAEENTKLAKLRSTLSTITEWPCKKRSDHIFLSRSPNTQRDIFRLVFFFY